MRSGWRNAAWLDAAGAPFDLIAARCKSAEPGLIERPMGVRRRGDAPPPRLAPGRRQEIAAGRRGGPPHRAARGAKAGHQISQATLVAADWLILALYRLRWRLELAFKRLQSLANGCKAWSACRRRRAPTHASPDPMCWPTC